MLTGGARQVAGGAVAANGVGLTALIPSEPTTSRLASCAAGGFGRGGDAAQHVAVHLAE